MILFTAILGGALVSFIVAMATSVITQSPYIGALVAGAAAFSMGVAWSHDVEKRFDKSTNRS